MNPIQSIHLIGCGGVGSYLLPALLKTFPIGHLHLWDGDRFEERNIDRQLFGSAFLGVNKAEALMNTYVADVQGGPKPGAVAPHTSYFTHGSWSFTPGDLIVVAVDNHAARRAVLAHADQDNLTVVLAMNEYTESQAILYNPKWSGTKLDPRVRYPLILTDESDDPTRPRGCTGEVQQAHPQLALANAISAQLALAHLFWWTQTRRSLDRQIAEDYAPVEHLWAAGNFTTKIAKDLR